MESRYPRTAGGGENAQAKTEARDHALANPIWVYVEDFFPREEERTIFMNIRVFWAAAIVLKIGATRRKGGDFCLWSSFVPRSPFGS